jgi:hypothetical protein
MDQPSGHEVRSSQLTLYAVYTHITTANSSCIRQLWTAPHRNPSSWLPFYFGSEQALQLDCSTLRLSLAKKWGFAWTYYALCYALLWQRDCEGFSITHNFIFYPFIIFYLAFYLTYFTVLYTSYVRNSVTWLWISFNLFWCTFRASWTVYYPDQQMHNIYIYVCVCVCVCVCMYKPTCFDVSASSSESLNLILC